MDRRDEVFPDIPLHGYTLETCLGHGTLTTVYRARKAKQETDSTVLVTFLRLPASLSAYTQWHFRERFWQYVERAETLQHPHLLPLAGYGERNTTCYFLTEEVPGTPLSTALARKMRWSPQEALTILTPIAATFTYLHQQNLAGFFFDPTHVQLLDPTQPGSLKIILAGLYLHTLFRRVGLEEKETNISQPYKHLQSFSGHYLGQPGYLAPEIIKGQQGTMQSDTYALGILLFTLLSGTLPFVGTHYLEIARQQIERPLPSLHERVPGLPIRLEVVVNRALSRDPALRFSSPEALLTAYKKSLEEQEDAEQQALQLFQRVYTIAGTSTRSQALLAIPEQPTIHELATSKQQLQIPLFDPTLQAPEEARISLREGSVRSGKQQTDTGKMKMHLSRIMERLQQQQEVLQARSQEASPKEASPKEASSSPSEISPFPAFTTTGVEWLN